MENQQLKQQLQSLFIREESLAAITKNKSFSTEAEAQQFIDDNKADLTELKQVREQIKSLEWELKSDKEKKEYQEMIEKIRDKHKYD